jgi:hypothetical protein
VLTVDEHGLAVHAPWRAAQSGIDRFVRESAKWVLRKLDEWSRVKPRIQRWASGEPIPFVGRLLTLDLAHAPGRAARVQQDADRLVVRVPAPEDPDEVKNAVVAWYRRHARSNFDERIARYAGQLGVATPRVFLSSARTRWGSCNSSREVRLNWRLIQTPQAVIDYVVVHELAHLREMNHSRRFWRLVAQACPAHEEARSYLDERGHWYLAI